MSGFADRLMLSYLDAVAVQHLLTPVGDADHARARSLLTSVYEPETLAFEAVDDVVVLETSYQVPIAVGRTSRGTWEKVTPAPEHSLLTLEAPAGVPTDWIDLTVQASVAVRVSGRGPVLETVAHQATTVPADADFAHEYRLHYADPPAYDPNDPEVRRTYSLRVCALFFAEPDLVGALRRLTAARREVDGARVFRDTHEGGAVRSAAAWIAVFDADVVPAAGSLRDDVVRLFAAEDAVAAFETA